MIDLDAPCGRHFVYRDLVECGETYHREATTCPIDNLPRDPGTLEALGEVCRLLLDPVVDAFGAVRLTYGFASPRLTRRIKGRIAPELDQHAGCERGRSGGLVCGRGGVAVDFLVPGVGGDDLARWVIEHAPFDRLYYYGADRPIHVSVGPEQRRDVVLMRASSKGTGRLIPSRYKGTF